MDCACLHILSSWAWPILFISAPATRRQDRDRWEEFMSWMATDIRKPTEACDLPESAGKPRPLSCTALLWGYICGSTGTIHWNCLYSCSTFKWWSTVEISPFSLLEWWSLFSFFYQITLMSVWQCAISVSFFNIKLAVENQEFKNKFFICRSYLTLLWLHNDNVWHW